MLQADRQGSFGDNVWAETIPLVPIWPSLHNHKPMDHKPMEGIFGPKTAIPLLASSDASTAMVNYSAFNYSIKFVPSKKNAVAAHCQGCPCRQRPMTKILHTMLKSG